MEIGTGYKANYELHPELSLGNGAIPPGSTSFIRSCFKGMVQYFQEVPASFITLPQFSQSCVDVYILTQCNECFNLIPILSVLGNLYISVFALV